MNHPFTNNKNWQDLQNTIKELALAQIMSRFKQAQAETKKDGSLLTQADLQMQIHTSKWLKENYPQFALVGEESTPEEQQKSLENPTGCWILDPVDGTTNFAHGIPLFSVSLALMIENQLVAGLVYDVANDEMFAARIGQGAELNGSPLSTKSSDSSHQIASLELNKHVGIIDFKRLTPTLATNLATNSPYASQRSIGSVALDWCWIAAARGQVYLHGAQSLWDFAAGWLILQEAGGASCDLNGEAVFKANLGKQSAIASTNPALLEVWTSWIKANS